VVKDFIAESAHAPTPIASSPPTSQGAPCWAAAPVAAAIDRAWPSGGIIAESQHAASSRFRRMEVQGAGDGTDGQQTPGDPQQHPGITASFSQRKELLNNPPPGDAALTRCGQPRPLRVALPSVPGSLFAWCLDPFPLLLAAIAMVKRKAQGTILAGLMPRVIRHRSCAGKSLAYLLVGECGCLGGDWLGGSDLPTQLRGTEPNTAALVGTTAVICAAVVFELYLGCAALTRIRRCRGCRCWRFSLGPPPPPPQATPPTAALGFIYRSSNYSPPLSLGCRP